MNQAGCLKRSSAARPVSGIVHLGLGAFFRAFGCVYIEDAMAASGGDWGVIGVSLRSPSIRDALRDQDWAYTSVSLAKAGPVARTIEVLNDVLVAPEDPQAVVRAMAAPEVKIVSLTVTEKGYCHNPSTGALNLEHADVAHDIRNAAPISAIGYLVRALDVRRKQGLDPFTVLTCDNLPDNGAMVRRLVLEMAAQIDADLESWIAAQGRFPSTMVDRITPATTDQDVAKVAALIGTRDAAPVMHEPFSQWAIEDDFVNGARPDFASAGAEMVADVTAHEHMKLRMLNGTHSALAYTGYLAGHETIAETVADPLFERYVWRLWQEIMPAVSAPDGVILTEYAEALFQRYANPGIRHRTWQIAMDGSQKLPQRLLGTLQSQLASGQDCGALCFALAGWMRYASGEDEQGGAIDVRDPLASLLAETSASQATPAGKVAAFLGIETVFPPELATELKAPVTAAAENLWAKGTRGALADLLGGVSS